MGLLPFVIRADAIGGRIEVDGEDVTDRVTAADLHFGEHEPSVLTLHHRPGSGPVEGEGIVQLVDYLENPVELIRRFLDSVDAAALEQAALESLDYDSSTAEAFIAALKDLL